MLDPASRQALVTARSLGRRGLRVAVISTRPAFPALRSRWCARGVIFATREATQEYLGQLEAWLDETGARVTIPASDGTISLLRRHRARVERSTRLAVAPESALDIAVNKERTLAVARRIGIPTPREVAVAGIGDLPAAAREIGFPAVVKPSESWVWQGETGSWVGPTLVVDDDGAASVVRRLEALGSRALVQEYLGGRREAVSFLYSRGRFYARFAQWARRTNPPLGGSSVLRQSIAVPSDVGAAAEALVREIGVEGYSEVEFRRDDRGVAHLMEINARLSASVEVAVRSGVDFPYLLYQWATGDPIDPVDGYRPGKWMRNLSGDIEATISILQEGSAPGSDGRWGALMDFGLSFVRPMGYDYFNWTDPLPAWAATSGYLRALSSRVLRRARRGH